MPIRSSLQNSFEWRRYDLEHYADMTVKHSVVQGNIEIDGPGEAISLVTFPVYYMEKPVFVFGHELADNSWPSTGNFPTVSASVIQWQISTRPDTKQYWTGAHLAIVTTGDSTMRSLLHFSFSGDAFRNPVITGATTTETL